MRYAKRLAHRVIEGQAFVVDPQGMQLHSLSPVASRIWRMVGQGKDGEAMVLDLAAEFDAPQARIRRDVAGFLDRLRSLGLVEP